MHTYRFWIYYLDNQSPYQTVLVVEAENEILAFNKANHEAFVVANGRPFNLDFQEGSYRD
jgi:hypothetical protein